MNRCMNSEGACIFFANKNVVEIYFHMKYRCKRSTLIFDDKFIKFHQSQWFMQIICSPEFK